MAQKSPILDQYGQPIRVNGHGRQDLIALMQPNNRVARLSYDAARDTTEFQNYWANSDRLDADSANSSAVRGKLVARSRYEAGSNGFYDGLVATCSNYLIGKAGPRLRLQSNIAGFNNTVELVWEAWAKALRLRRKLWCMAHAKYQDGEPFAVAVSNPRLKSRIKLDLRLIETEQCQTPALPFDADGYIDGIKFDAFGNPEWYDILPTHPGSNNTFSFDDPIRVPAKFVLHWFQLLRPGQHRGIPEFKSSLNVGASSRRFREATVTSAESAADFSVLLHTMFQPEELDQVTPLTTVELLKRTMMALPGGWDATQLEAKHPNATYESFLKSQLTETGRPKSVPFNLTACDSSDANFASGKLDREAFYAALDTDREDGNDCVLDPLFDIFWEEAVREYGWNADPELPPPHLWDWPRYPVADAVASASATDTRLKNGSTYPSAVYAEDGRDFDDELPKMAADYGVTADEMRKILLQATFNAQNQQASMQQAETQAEVAAKPPPNPPAPPADEEPKGDD